MPLAKMVVAGVCPGWGSVTLLCARSRGEPSSAHCEQRLSERLTPCPCDPVCACVLNGFFTRCRMPTPEDGEKAIGILCLRTQTQRSEPCRDGGVGWGGWGPIWRAQGV